LEVEKLKESTKAEPACLTAGGEEVFKPHIKKNLTPGANKG